MRKFPYLYITFIAIIAVFILQSVWFIQNYRILEDELFYQLNKAFIEAIHKESVKRYEKDKLAISRLPEARQTPFNEIMPAVERKVRWHKKGEENINEFMEVMLYQELLFKMDSLGICKNSPDYTQLDSIFREELIKVGFIHPRFRIDSDVSIDPARYPYLNDLIFDSARVKNRHEMTTSLCPTQIRYTSGHQGHSSIPRKKLSGN